MTVHNSDCQCNVAFLWNKPFASVPDGSNYSVSTLALRTPSSIPSLSAQQTFIAVDSDINKCIYYYYVGVVGREPRCAAPPVVTT